MVARLTFTHPVSRVALANRVALTAQRNGGKEAIESGKHDRSAVPRSAPLAIPERSYYGSLRVPPASGRPISWSSFASLLGSLGLEIASRTI